MDPHATWAELLRAYRESDHEACRQACRDLLSWLTRGGVPPTITGIATFDRAMARAVCSEHVFWAPEEESTDEN
jgi:hypothetical protein